jgi:hypothetical protein
VNRRLWIVVGLLVVAACSSSAARPIAANGIVPQRPTALAAGPNGVLYVADPARQQILALHRNGGFTVFAGTGKAGFSGDGGPATSARLNDPAGMAVAKDGTLYFADQQNYRIRAINPDGRIRTVAGDGDHVGIHFVSNGTQATKAAISPSAVAFGPDGDLYLAAGLQVLRLNPVGTLTPMLGGHDRNHGGVTGAGGPAVDASADGAEGLAFDSHGALFVAGFNTKALLVVVHGVLRVPTSTSFYPRYAGDLVEDADGVVYAGDGTRLDRLYTAGPMETSVGRELSRLGVGPFEVDGIAAASSGVMYADTYAGNGFSRGSAIAEIAPGGDVHLLWRS